MLRIAGCLLRMELLYQIAAAIAIKAIKDSLFEDSLLRNHTDCMTNTNVVLLIRVISTITDLLQSRSGKESIVLCRGM